MNKSTGNPFQLFPLLTFQRVERHYPASDRRFQTTEPAVCLLFRVPRVWCACSGIHPNCYLFHQRSSVGVNTLFAVAAACLVWLLCDVVETQADEKTSNGIFSIHFTSRHWFSRRDVIGRAKRSFVSVSRYLPVFIFRFRSFQGRSQDFSKGGAEVMEAKALKRKNCLWLK